jgi:large conductance mechanosensitive channel
MGKDFKEFILRGNVVDLAVAVIIGAAFGTIVTSLVNDIVMPPIGLLLGNVDFTDLFLVFKEGAKAAGPYATLADAQAACAVTINYCVFITRIVSFLVVAFAVFMMVRGMNRMKRSDKETAAAPVTKECPFCASTISIKASRCPNCTSQLS